MYLIVWVRRRRVIFFFFIRIALAVFQLEQRARLDFINVIPGKICLGFQKNKKTKLKIRLFMSFMMTEVFMYSTAVPSLLLCTTNFCFLAPIHLWKFYIKIYWKNCFSFPNLFKIHTKYLVQKRIWSDILLSADFLRNFEKEIIKTSAI